MVLLFRFALSPSAQQPLQDNGGSFWLESSAVPSLCCIRVPAVRVSFLSSAERVGPPVWPCNRCNMFGVHHTKKQRTLVLVRRDTRQHICHLRSGNDIVLDSLSPAKRPRRVRYGGLCLRFCPRVQRNSNHCSRPGCAS